ncbi:MAG: 50S ribosomal protein L4 [Candidatus Pacearchaeota archaeon]
MKAQVLNIEGKKIKEIELPKCFEEEIRPDLIYKVFWTIQKRQQQPYGSYILAGKEVAASGKQRHRRRKWKTLYGKGISRIPRKTLSHRGEQFYWIGAFIPGTVGGREAHPPKPIKRKIKINKKEKQKALFSAIAASSIKDIIEKKYPKIKLKTELPVVISSEVIDRKAKEIINLFENLFGIKLKKNKKIRAGKGKKRGRKYKGSNKVLLVISKDEKVRIKKYGVDVVKTNQLNILNMAPGGIPGRLVVWTEKAINELNKLKNENIITTNNN